MKSTLVTVLSALLIAFALTGCTNAATKACQNESPGQAARGTPAGGGMTACNACCQKHGTYQAANNNVEATCKCN